VGGDIGDGEEDLETERGKVSSRLPAPVVKEQREWGICRWNGVKDPIHCLTSHEEEEKVIWARLMNTNFMLPHTIEGDQ
jgi:hypothetical protein